MKLVSFVADNAAAALAEVHKRLGPDAVIVSVRQLPAPGLAWFWNRKGRIEVTAGVPDKTSASKPDHFSPTRDLTGFQSTLQGPQSATEPGAGGSGQWTERWRSIAWLETMGLMPVHAERLQMHMRALHDEAPGSLEKEWEIVSGALAQFWLNPPPLDDGPARPHVFIGPPGSGKTTALCKWLTLATLLEGAPPASGGWTAASPTQRIFSRFTAKRSTCRWNGFGRVTSGE